MSTAPYRIVSAEGLPPKLSSSHLSDDDENLDPEALLQAFPPPGPVTLVFELLVHVDIPERGLSLRIPAEGYPDTDSPTDAMEAGTSSSHSAQHENKEEVTLAVGKPVSSIVSKMREDPPRPPLQGISWDSL